MVCDKLLFSGLEGASQTPAAEAQEHCCSDHQNGFANEEDARVGGGGAEPAGPGGPGRQGSPSPLGLQLLVLPVPAARHPDLPDLSVCRWRPKRDPGRRGEQRDVSQWLQQIAALLPGQLQRAAGESRRTSASIFDFVLFVHGMVAEQVGLKHVHISDWKRK